MECFETKRLSFSFTEVLLLIIPFRVFAFPKGDCWQLWLFSFSVMQLEFGKESFEFGKASFENDGNGLLKDIVLRY
jgi:hypothetical protein